jgi:catechol 2,3-dioxygenase
MAVVEVAPKATDVLEAFQAPLRIGAVMLAVRNLEGAVATYAGLIGLDVLDRGPDYVRLGSSGETVLELVHRPDAEHDRTGEPGLFHTAFVLPSRAALAQWFAGAVDRGLRLTGASDHKVSEALYFTDDEGNGIEVYADRPRGAWQRSGSEYVMRTDRLALDTLLAEGRMSSGTRDASVPIKVGHVHLRARDLDAARSFYHGTLGFAVTHGRPGALWFGAGGYHHHVATNVWSSDGAAPRRKGGLGLVGYELVARDAQSFAETAVRIGGRGVPTADALVFEDPSGIEIRLCAPR